jgi:ribosome biogenesis protein BRX1
MAKKASSKASSDDSKKRKYVEEMAAAAAAAASLEDVSDEEDEDYEDEGSLEEDNGTDLSSESGEGSEGEEEEEEEGESDEEDADEDADEDDDADNDDEDDDADTDTPLPTEEAFALQHGVPSSLVSPSPLSTGTYINKQRCLVLASRGVTSRHRHLLEDIRTLLPHMKKDSKLDEKQQIAAAVNEIASVKSCNSAVLLECRKRQDVYMWTALTPNGPSVKFHLTNVHTMDELKLTGNCMKGSRPLLSFDNSFSTLPHFQLIKEIFVEIFGTPRGHPKSKPFVDRVMCFYVSDNRIWVRNYQIAEEEALNAKEARDKKLASGLDTSLVEIGPRFVLEPMRIFAGSFGGQTIYQNTSFISPNTVRANEAKGKGEVYVNRKNQQEGKKRRVEEALAGQPEDLLKDVFR